ncbi:unnamed protein product [Brassicogethes aeneus]|uniref:Uncharacterized protein n=1 Tax=Brassicogethes aeneus TaxID=1431903 RepID=A0A9P0B1A7_BRAAE|nr:unnamed protein product [Brassicogethes aeneus]
MKKLVNSVFNLNPPKVEPAEVDNKTTSVSHSVVKPVASHKTQDRNDEVYVENWVVIPPDGGWGWVVVFSSFMCNFVTDGCMYSFGMFLEEIGEELKATPNYVAIANSIMSGFYFLLGPVTCALMNRFGFRTIGITGSIISSIALFASSLLTHITPFLLVLGILGGIGFNMIFTPSFVVVGFYFERWRALATSIAVCGSSIGMVVFPFVATKLLGSLTWRSKFQIIGASLFCCSFLCITFKPLKPTNIYISEEKRVQFIKEIDSIGSFHIENEGEKNKNFFKRFHSILFPSKQDVTSSMISSLDKKASVDNSYLIGATGTSASSVADKSGLKSINSDRLFTVPEEDEQEINHNLCCYRTKVKCFECCEKLSCARRTTENRPMYREDIFYTGSLYTVPEYSRSIMAGPSTKKSAIEYHVSVTKVATQQDLERKYLKCLPVSVMTPLRKMLDFGLFKNVAFILILLSGMFSLLGCYTPFVFSELRASENGVPASMTYLVLSVVGVSNTFGRITCGIISSFPKINALTVTYVCTIFCGLVTIASNYFYSFEWQIVYSVFFGFSIACLSALKSVILVDLLGLEKLTNAFGLLLLFQGVASFIGVPTSGALKNYTGSYKASFLFAGCSICLSGLLLIPITFLKTKRDQVIEENKDEQDKDAQDELHKIDLPVNVQSLVADLSDAASVQPTVPIILEDNIKNNKKQ